MHSDFGFLNGLFRQSRHLLLIIVITISACPDHINQIIPVHKLLKPEHGDHRQAEPEHFFSLCHCMVNIIKPCHILAASTDSACKKKGLQKICKTALQIFPGQDALLSLPVMVDPIK